MKSSIRRMKVIRLICYVLMLDIALNLIAAALHVVSTSVVTGVFASTVAVIWLLIWQLKKSTGYTTAKQSYRLTIALHYMGRRMSDGRPQIC